MIGETVGSYKILSKLSVGGMGTVWRAEHTLIGKLAAVKVLHPELSSSRDIVNRFFNEAKATTSIKHPGIVEVFDFGYMASGHAYLTMEFLEGMSLARRLKTRGRMSEGEAAMMLRGVCSALAAAHAKGIVHRDLKPDNIFLVTDPDAASGERPKILDFGIAKLTDIGLAGSATKTGAVMGTPTYMAPEQCRGTGNVDHRADLYSIGCIMYELVVGRPPFTNLGAGELIGAHIYEEPDPPSKHRAIAADTEKLIMSLLDKRPERRPQTAKELAQRLSQLAQQLGWITVTSPDGVTARALHELANSSPTIVGDVGHDDPARLLTTAPPESADATTPFDAGSSIHSIADVVEQPTTLSGAASQSVIDTRRSRKGLGFAMLGAALLGGGAVAFVKYGDRGGDDSAKVAPAAPTAPMPAPDLPKPDPKPVATPDPEPPPVEPVKADPVETVKPAPRVAAPKPKPVRPKPKPAITKPKPPDKPKCDQPPCIQPDV